MLNVSSITMSPANSVSTYQTLTLDITGIELAGLGIDIPDGLTATAHCCAWANPRIQYMVVDPITIGGKKAKNHYSFRYGDLEKFPYEQARKDFISEVEYMLAQFES